MDIKQELREMRVRLALLEQHLRINIAAEQFLANEHKINEGDYVKFSDGHAAHITNINDHDGKWTYMDRRGHRIESFRVPPEDGIERLYTIAEVGEILARGLQAGKGGR